MSTTKLDLFGDVVQPAKLKAAKRVEPIKPQPVRQVESTREFREYSITRISKTEVMLINKDCEHLFL